MESWSCQLIFKYSLSHQNYVVHILVGLSKGYGVERHVQQYFCLIVAVSCIVEENRSTWMDKSTLSTCLNIAIHVSI